MMIKITSPTIKVAISVGFVFVISVLNKIGKVYAQAGDQESKRYDSIHDE